MDRFTKAQEFYDKNANYAELSYKNRDLLPHRYVLVLTNLCNLKCSFCFQERKRREDRMTTENWVNFIEQIPERSRITLTGGEPLVFKDFDRIFKLANKNSFTNMITNGVLLKPETSELLLSEKNFKVLGISVDNIGNTNRDFKKNQWESLIEDIKYFRERREKLNHDCVIDIKTVVLEEDIENLFEIHKFCVENFQCDTHSLQLLKGAEIQHSDIMFEYKDINKSYKAYKYKNFENLIHQLNMIREYNLKKNSKAFLHPNIINLNSEKKIKLEDYSFLNNEDHDPKFFKKCLSPWTSVHVNVDGNLFPCMAVPMGNVKKEKLKDIIFSDKFLNFKKLIDEQNTVGGCNRCGWLKT